MRHSFIICVMIACFGYAGVAPAQNDRTFPGQDSLSGSSRLFERGLTGITSPSLLYQSPGFPGKLGPVIYRPVLLSFTPIVPHSFMREIDLLAPWKLELAKQDELQTLRIILGTAVLGGAVYTGYEHVRKYGIW